MTDEQVAEIRRLCAERKLTQAEIGARFGISQAAVSKIKRGGTRRNLPGADAGDGRGKVTGGQRREILAMLEAGIAQRDIAERYGISQSRVSLIRRDVEEGRSARG